MPLHPQAKAFLAALATQEPPAWDEMSSQESRDVFASLGELFGTGPELPEIENQTLAGRVPVRIYRPTKATNQPCVVYYHGGGWVLGDLDTHDTLCRRLAAGSGCTVISVHYRRPPEDKFPTPLDDCFGALQYISEHASVLGVDANRIAVAGDSAGGNLAAAAALRARDESGPKIHSQWLIYPVLDRNFNTGSYEAFAENHGLSLEEMKWFWSQYLKSDADSQNPYASPLRAKSLEGLPESLILTSEYDVLRDEGEAYAKRLMDAGVPVTLKRFDGMLHGFVHFSEPFDDSKVAIAYLSDAMRKSLQP